MVLSDVNIRELLRKKVIRIEPLGKGAIGADSVDLKLSNEFWVLKKKYEGNLIDLGKAGWKRYYKKIIKKYIDLNPGQLILGMTVERIKLPNNIMGILSGRSRYARMGLTVHITSPLVHASSHNRQLLEIKNDSAGVLRIHAGMKISQITFHRLESATKKPYARYGDIAKKQ